MKIYLGFTGNKNVAEFMHKYECGWLFNPTNYSKNFRESFILDNGAFSAWIKNPEWKENGKTWEEVWDEVAFYNYLRTFTPYKPDFTIIPDQPAMGMDSFHFSLKHLNRIPHPRYLAVQDDMPSTPIHKWLLGNPTAIDGLFVGGTVPWKLQTAKMWVDLAHLHKIQCHVGRIGTFQGYAFCDSVDVDSVDGTNPSRNNDERPLKQWAEQSTLAEYEYLWMDIP